MEFVVAPYEADAQMTYLAISGRVHAVITEDSDMLPYGCVRVSASSMSEIKKLLYAKYGYLCQQLFCMALQLDQNVTSPFLHLQKTLLCPLS